MNTDEKDAHPDWIVERDDEGNVLYEVDLSLCNDVADDMLSDMMELEGELENFDFAAAVFSVFVNSIHILLDAGWTQADLVNEVQDHAVHHVADGETQH